MSSSHVTYSSHPDDPSLITVHQKYSKACGDYNQSCGKLKKLTAQNEKLREKLERKEKEVTDLRQENSHLDQRLSMLAIECNSISTQKISDLSKANRHLTAQLSSQKSKCREMESKINQLEQMLCEKDHQLREKIESESEREAPEPSELQQLQDELKKTKERLFEFSNQNLQLKNELKMACKCLHQEIGDDVNINKLLAGGSNWRGRAEQISMLQSKVNELKEKLDSDFESYESSRVPLKNLDSIRRMEIEAVTKELEDCKTELEDVKQKLIALRTRNKNLSDDLNNYKLKTLDLLEKSSRDDDYVKSLKEKIKMTEFECDHKIGEMEKEIEKAEKVKEDSELEVQKLQCHIDNLNDLIAEKENQISNLKEEKENLESSLKNVSGDFLFSCRDMSKNEYQEMMKTIEDEKNQCLAMMRDLTERCNKAALRENEQHEMIMKQKGKISRLEAKVKEFEAEREAMKIKHKRSNRINEYSRSMNGSNSSQMSSQKMSNHSAIDSLKIKLESATERIQYLENKLKIQSEEHESDVQKFVNVLGNSKEKFHEIFSKGSMATTESCVESAMEEMTEK